MMRSKGRDEGMASKVCNIICMRMSESGVMIVSTIRLDALLRIVRFTCIHHGH